MFKKIIKAAALAGTIALGGVAATTGTASADSGIYFGSGGGISIHFDGGRRYGHSRGNRRGYYNRCSPRKALRKARRKGVRRAYVARVSGRGVIVKGRKWGDRVKIGFANNRRCSVRFVRSR